MELLLIKTGGCFNNDETDLRIAGKMVRDLDNKANLLKQINKALRESEEKARCDFCPKYYQFFYVDPKCLLLYFSAK